MKNLKKIVPILMVLCALIFWSSCKSKKEVNASSPINEDKNWQPTENSLLWEIKKPGKQTSYIFGTVHLIPAEQYFMPDTLAQILTAVDAIYFEIDMDEMTDMSAQFAMLGKIMMEGGTSLEDLLSPEDYQLVVNHIEGMGMPMFLMKKVKPMFLTMLLDLSIEDLTSGSSSNDMKSYEMELNSMAEQYGKETEGLETMDYQIGLFDSIPYTSQAQMLVEAVKNKSAGIEDTTMDSLYFYYGQQNIKQLYEITSVSEFGEENTMDILLNQRNKNWIPIIGSKLQNQKILFAVGAGHLGGTQGVLALLKKEGYTLRPIFN